MDDFAGRMTAIGWAALKHLDRISQVTTNPASDRARLDLEVMVYWAILRQKVAKNTRFQKEWPELMDELEAIKEDAGRQQGREADTERQVEGVDVEGDRLTIRVLQLELLISCAVEEGVLDVASLPHDDRRRNGMAKVAA